MNKAHFAKFGFIHQKQLNCLIYLTVKNMVEYFGPVLVKGIKLPVNLWVTIAQKLNEMPGQRRTPQDWAKTFTSTKFAVVARFIKFVDEQKNKYGEHYQPDWTNIKKLNLLLLHEYCTQYNFSDIPSIPEILNSIEMHNLTECEVLNDDFNDKLYTAPKKSLERPVEKTISQGCIPKTTIGEQNSELDISAKSSAFRGDNVNNKTISNKHSRVHRTSKNTVQSYYLTYLAYLALKRIVNTHGELYRKNCRLSVHAWNHIAKQMLKETGFSRPAEQWRKTFSSNKYVVQSRFLERLKQNGEVSSAVNWKNVRVEELLFLQPLRHEGYTDMPSAQEVLRAYEQQFMLHRNIEMDDNFITPNFMHDNEDQTFFDNTAIANENYDLDPVEVKTEMISDNDLSLEETFEITEILDNGAKRKLEDATFSSDISNSRRRTRLNKAYFSTSDPISTAVNGDWSETLENEDSQQNFGQKLNGEKVESQEQSAEHYYLERRLLEINEKILNEKIKKNKILRKRNKLLKKQTKIFDKMCTKLDILIDKKSI